LIELIKKAKKSISFAVYGFKEQEEIIKELKLAIKRGIEIKGVVDSDTKGNNYYSHISKIKKHIPNITNDNKSYIMHNKFFIIDDRYVWTGSTNLSGTGTGGYNANSVVVIDNIDIAFYYNTELNQMLNGKFQRKKQVVNTSPVYINGTRVETYFSPKSSTYKNAIRSIIINAKDTIDIPIFFLTHKILLRDLIKAKKRGVKIRIIIDATAANNKYSIHQKLRDNKIAVKVENFGGKMHVKSAIVDNKIIIAGSMNFTAAGEDKNDENTLIIHSEKLAIEYTDYFNKLWRKIPKKYLYKNPNAESFESGNSCFDGIDNNFNHQVDDEDWRCVK
jgi:phosphatidylserine/phosphatidylglycerophosphate/cardiolipin synthase-like enzyme